MPEITLPPRRIERDPSTPANCGAAGPRPPRAPVTVAELLYRILHDSLTAAALADEAVGSRVTPKTWPTRSPHASSRHARHASRTVAG